jgi:hypothetical protein
MSTAGFEPTIPASQRPQTDAFIGAATGIGAPKLVEENMFERFSPFSN